MKERILDKNKNGMQVLLICLGVMLLGIAAFFLGMVMGDAGAWVGIPGLVIAVLTIFPLCGLKVLKPQEALVLTLFGNYVGTIKGEGGADAAGADPGQGTGLRQAFLPSPGGEDRR